MRLDLVVTLGVGIAGISLGFAGFAFALFATASLALLHPPQVVVPAVILLGGTLSPWLILEHRGVIRWETMRAVPIFRPDFLLTLWAGVVAGTLLLGVAPAWGGRLALGILVLGFVAYSARTDRPGRGGSSRRLDGPAAGRALGLASGVLQGWLGTGGPPIVAYLASLRVDRATFIVAFAGAMLLSDAVRSLAYVFSGYWTRGVLGLYLVSLPAALAGFLLGVALRRKIPAEEVFRRVILGLLALNGAALVFRALGG